MSELTIWFDESGFTGEDLMNPDQRHFALASTIIPDDEAAALLRECFPGYNGNEYKFSAIWRRDNHRKGLLRLAARMPDNYERVFVYNIDKRFSLLIKFIDYLIEPLFYQMGYDFYAGGYSRRYVNMVNSDLAAYDGGKVYDEIIVRWNRFARKPTREELGELKAYVHLQAETVTTTLAKFFETAEKGIDFLTIGDERLVNFYDTNDLQLTAMMTSLAFWRNRRDEDFRIVHDESTAFFKQRSMWEALTRNDAEPFEMLSAAGMPTVFPLRIVGTSGEQSERSTSIQLCDLLAGLCTRLLRGRGKDVDPFVLNLMLAGFGDMPMSGVMPEDERVTDLPPRRNGPDSIDRIVSVLRPHFEERHRASESSSDAP